MTSPRFGSGRVLAKYLILQVPGWLGVGALLAAAVHWWGLGTPLALALFAGWVIKDFALFPVLRHAYGPAEASPSASLRGARGVVTREVDPRGYVRIGAELWSARVADGQAPLPVGTPVRVLDVEGLTLWVEPESGPRVGTGSNGPPR